MKGQLDLKQKSESNCKRTLVALLILLCATFSAGLASQTKSAAKSPHLNLMRKVFPDITSELSAQRSVVVRHIHNDYQAQVLSGNMQISEDGFYPIRNGSHQDCVLVLSVSHSGEATNSWGAEKLVALFRIQPHPRLLDVADIQMDRESGIWTKPAVLPGGNHDALISYFSHLNAGEEFLGLGLIEVARDKFIESKAALPLAYSASNATAEIREAPSLVPGKTAGQAIFQMKVVGKKVDEDSHKTLKRQSKVFSIPLAQKDGRWHCVSSANKTSKSIGNMQTRFGFSDD